MAIRNIVPRNNNEGQLGTENKKWNKIYTNEIFATNFTGNLTGTADNAIKDNKNQQIDATYIKNISINNDTLTVTKENDDSQNIVVNNISHAISSDNTINANKLQELTAGNSLNKGDIIFKQAFNIFDAILIEFTNDGGETHDFNLIPMWLFIKKYNTKGRFDLFNVEGHYWRVRGSSCPTRPSTTIRLNIWEQNTGIIEIYGVTYK